MKSQKTGRGALIYLGSKLLTKAVSFLLIPVWTLAFTPAEYGTIGNLMAWAGFLSPLIMIGLPSAVVRMRADCRHQGEWERFVQSIALVLLATSGVFLVCGWLFGASIWNLFTSGDISFWPLVPITLVAVALGALARLALAVYQAEQQASKVMYFEQALSLGVIIWALFFVFVVKQGVAGYMVGGLTGAAMVSAFFGVRLLKQSAGFHFEGGLVKNAIIYGLPMLPQAVASWTLNLSDRVMIERFSGLSQAGLYNLAANFGVVISMVAISIDQAILPKYLQLAGGPVPRSAIRKLTVGGLIGLASVTVLLLAGGPIALSLMINSRYTDSLPLVGPILMGCFFFGLYQFFLRPLILARRTKMIAGMTMVGAILNVAANFILIPKYGAIAAAWTTLGSYMVTGFCAMMVSRTSDNMELRLGEIALVSLLVIFTFGVSLAWSGNDAGALTIRIGVALIAIVILFKFFWKSLKNGDSHTV